MRGKTVVFGTSEWKQLAARQSFQKEPIQYPDVLYNEG